MNPKETLHKAQNQSETTKKVIVWGVTIVLGVILFGWWFLSAKNSLQQNQGPSFQEQLRLESLGQELGNIPTLGNGTE